jgi:hypothetical protein
MAKTQRGEYEIQYELQFLNCSSILCSAPVMFLTLTYCKYSDVLVFQYAYTISLC